MIDETTGTLTIALESRTRPLMRDVAIVLLSELEKIAESDRQSIKRVRVLYHKYVGIQTIPVHKGWDGLISMIEEQKTWEG